MHINDDENASFPVSLGIYLQRINGEALIGWATSIAESAAVTTSPRLCNWLVESLQNEAFRRADAAAGNIAEANPLSIDCTSWTDLDLADAILVINVVRQCCTDAECYRVAQKVQNVLMAWMHYRIANRASGTPSAAHIYSAAEPAPAGGG